MTSKYPMLSILISTCLLAASARADDGLERAVSESPSINSPNERSEFTSSLGIPMKQVPAGEFLKGSISFREFERRGRDLTTEARIQLLMQDPPQRHEVISSSFSISTHEVTIGQFRQFIDATNYRTEAETDSRGGTGRLPNGEWGTGKQFNWQVYGFPVTDRHAVANVSWNDAVTFCNWLSKKEGQKYRLPTETEWEYACRAGTTTTFSTGNDPTSLEGYANIADKSLAEKTPGLPWALAHTDTHPFLAPVGSFKPNQWGLHDMHGNVLEWCGTHFSALDPIPQAKAPQPQPIKYTLRGGHWFGEPSMASSACRSGSEPSLRMALIGFRVVAESAPQPTAEVLPNKEPISPESPKALDAEGQVRLAASVKTARQKALVDVRVISLMERITQIEQKIESVYIPEGNSTADYIALLEAKDILTQLNALASNLDRRLDSAIDKAAWTYLSSNEQDSAVKAGLIERPATVQTHAPKSATISSPKSTQQGLVENAVLPPEVSNISPGSSEMTSTSKSIAGASVESIKQTFENSLGMQFCLLPASSFLMGSTPQQIRQAQTFDPQLKQKFIDRETPEHEVKLTCDFYIGTHEVTRKNFAAFVDATRYETEAERTNGGYGWNQSTRKFEGPLHKYSWRETGFPVSDEHPVVNVSWNDAIEFCKWLSKTDGINYRLPTEAEWEYAARAGSVAIYSFGDNPEQLLKYANANDAKLVAVTGNSSTTRIRGSDGYAFTAPVGSFQPNAFGIYDTHGNVWEWCADLCDDSYYNHSPAEDPQGGSVGPGRVFRGGGFAESWRGCRTAIRARDLPSKSLYAIGFRIAITP